MPGGLASWLDDDSIPRKNSTKRRRPLQQLSSAIDVDAALPGATDAGGGTNNLRQASPGESPWNPFSNASRRVGNRPDAFALLRQGAAVAKHHPATASASPKTSTGFISNSSPDASRRNPPAPSSPWDPFASAAGGKENRGNAFSKLLASPSQQQQNSSHRGRSFVGGPSKKAKLSPSATTSSGGQTGAEAEAAATRFCECPVCGKRVIIELCGKHLDTECRGPNAEAASPLSSAGSTPRSKQASPSARFMPASSMLARSESPSPRHRSVSRVPLRPLGPPVHDHNGARNESSGASISKPASPATGEVPDEVVKDANGSSSPCVNTEAAGRRTPSSPLTSSVAATAAAAAGTAAAAACPEKQPSSTRKRKARGSLSSPRQGGRRAAASAAAAALSTAEARVMTSCPVCGKHVHADRCSWHLDNDCAGASPPSVALAESEGSKSVVGLGTEREREKGEGEMEAEDRCGDGSRQKKDAQRSEVEGGLSALAAELKCPICLCVFDDVHSLPCSHRFCRECILGCFKSSKRQECPLCKIPAWKRDLTRDVPLHNIILAYQRMAN